MDKKKTAYLLEVAIGIFVILFVNITWFKHNMGFIGVSPNPYWVIVIFVAARYGSFQGFIAGLMCSAALLVSVSYNQAIEYQLAFAGIPIKQLNLSALFILMGFLVGEEHSRVERLLRKGKVEHNRLRNEFESLAMEHLALKEINLELEGRILGQAETVNSFYEVARELVTLKLEKLYPSIGGIIQKFVGSSKCSFYVAEDGKFLLKGQKGWKKQDIEKREVLEIKSDIVKKTVEDKKIVTVKDIVKTGGLKWEHGKDPIMVAPLFFGESKNEVTGFILVDDISFLKLNPNSVRFLSILADWVSKALDNAFATTTVRRKDIYDEDLKVFNFNYAIRRLKEECVDVDMSGKDSAVLLVKLRDYNLVREDIKEEVLKAIAFVLSHTLRGGDIVTRYSQKDTFMAILPGTDKTGAKIVADRVKEHVTAFAFEGYPDVEKPLDVDVEVRPVEQTCKVEVASLGAGGK